MAVPEWSYCLIAQNFAAQCDGRYSSVLNIWELQSEVIDHGPAVMDMEEVARHRGPPWDGLSSTGRPPHALSRDHPLACKTLFRVRYSLFMITHPLTTPLRATAVVRFWAECIAATRGPFRQQKPRREAVSTSVTKVGRRARPSRT